MDRATLFRDEVLVHGEHALSEAGLSAIVQLLGLNPDDPEDRTAAETRLPLPFPRVVEGRDRDELPDCFVAEGVVRINLRPDTYIRPRAQLEVLAS
jgi:hypothetical protein